MAFDISDAKIKARRRVHDLAAVAAFYSDDDLAEPVPLTVRWHNKIIGADTINSTSEIISGVDRLVFLEEELDKAGLVLQRGGVVTIPKYDSLTFQLEYEEPNDGPVTTAWSVSNLS